MNGEDMSAYCLTITVKSIQGECPLYKVGDKIVLEKFYIKTMESDNVCIHVFSAMLSLLSAFVHGASAIELGIGTEEDKGYLRCPDPGPPYTKGGTVLFEIKREVIKE